MTHREEIIGKAVGGEIADQLCVAFTGDSFPAIVVVNFKPTEINHIVPMISDIVLDKNKGPVKIVVTAKKPWPGLSESYFLSPDETSTSFRNNNESGLVIIEYDPQSDRQGLRNMKVLNDSTLLTSGREENHGLRRLLENTWTIYSTPGDRLSSVLALAIFDIHKFLSRRRTISLRDWVNFLEECCIRLTAERRAWESEEIRCMVGSSLFRLGLFPDPMLFTHREARLDRRIEQNSNFSRPPRNASGREVNEDDLLQDIARTQFHDEDGKPLPKKEIERLQKAAHEIVEPIQECDYSTITFDQWKQIFDKERNRAKLGDQVYDHIERRSPERIDELDALDYRDRLNEEDQEAANEFARMVADGSEALFDLLDRRLQRRIEKAAAPRVSIETDPLRALLYAIHRFLDAPDPENGDTLPSVVLSVDNLRVGEGKLSLHLFRWLYRKTLLDIVVETEESNVGYKLSLDRSLTEAPKRLEDVLSAPKGNGEDDDGDDLPLQWKELRFVLQLSNGGEVLHRFVWRPMDDPGIVAFVRLIQSIQPVVHVSDVDEDSLDSWAEKSLDVRADIKGVELEPGSPGDPVEQWLGIRAEMFQTWAIEGMSVQSIDEYLQGWVALLHEIRNDSRYVPNGSTPNDTLTAFLRMDTFVGKGDKYAQLATHPLRLRWIARHFEEMHGKIVRVLERVLDLNSINPSFFFDHLARVSPHKQPPVYCPRDGVLAVSTREFGWHEEFSLISRDNAVSNDWVSEVDDASIKEIASAVHTYLSSFPHKIDGLSLLLLSHDGESRAIRRLVNTIRQRDYSSIRLNLHIAAPRDRHSEIARDLSELETMEDRDSRLMPPLRIHLHPWVEDAASSLFEMLEHEIDIAVVPNYFGINTLARENTFGSRDGREGRFNPWIDKTSHTESTDPDRPTINVTKVLLPDTRDDLLDTWSTLNVWHYRNGPVSTQSDNIDYFTLQVRFDTNRELFSRLHDIAHWVVTLDAFIGRDQVESLSEHPDIITVKPDIGKNDMYTLIVSSSTGQSFVKRRLAKRLQKDLNLQIGNIDQAVDRLYTLSRNATPGLVLRALGLGHATQEILGLITSRHAVCEHLPKCRDTVFEAWLNLDEHMDWFGGAQQPRADMVRLLGVRENNGSKLRLKVQVIESKFREHEDVSHADQQVERTMALLKDALEEKNDNQDEMRDDATFWRMELLSALSQCSKKNVSERDFPSLVFLEEDGTVKTELSMEIREIIRSGEYKLEPVEGVVCTVAYGMETVDEAVSQTPRGHHWLRMGRSDLNGVFSKILDGDEIKKGEEDNVDYTEPIEAQDQTPQENTNDGKSELDNDPEPDEIPDDPRSSTVKQPAVKQSTEELPVVGPSERGLGQDGLLRKYQIILDAFGEFGVAVQPYEPEPFLEGPGFFLVRVVPGRGIKPDSLMDRTDELKLKLGLPAQHSPLSYIDEGTIVFEIPKANVERYMVYAEDLWNRTEHQPNVLYAPVGENVRGEVIGINFSSSDTPHLLIAGTTGSGKSVALESILRGLCHYYDPDQLQLSLIDPKGTELESFEGDPHLMQPIGGFADDAIVILEEAIEEMQRRYKILREHRVRDISAYKQNNSGGGNLPWRMLVLDEYADLTSDKEDRRVIESLLRRLAQKARACGIHVIVATQKPAAEIISTTIRSNLPAQLALRVSTATDSRIIMDENGAESLAGAGDAFLKTARGKVRIQCAMLRSDTR